MVPPQDILFQNRLGMISKDMVFLAYKKGEVRIPLREITSVEYRYKRGWVEFGIGLVGGLLTLAALPRILENPAPAAIVVLLVLLSFFGLTAAIGWIGRHKILIQSSQRKLAPFKIDPSRAGEAKALYEAMRKATVGH